MTNNNTRTVDDYVTKLSGLGLDADPGMIFTSSTVTANYLKARYGAGAPVHAVGMSGLIEPLKEAGFDLTHGEQVPEHDVVAVAETASNASMRDQRSSSPPDLAMSKAALA